MILIDSNVLIDVFSRDPVWMADGIIAEEWAPISPVTGALDAFEWRTPPSPSKGASADTLLEDMAALSQELEAVARVIPEVSVATEPSRAAAREKSTVIDQTPVVTSAPEGRPAAPTVIRQAPASSPRPAAAQEPRREPVVEIQPMKPATPSDAARAANRDAQSRPIPVETVRPAPAAAPAAMVRVSPPTSGVPPVGPVRRVEPKIFVPDRAPDDPGPEPAEPEEAQTPLGRFLSSMKQQTT